MRIKGIGIDLVEFEEIEEHLNDAFVERILSERELDAYHALRSEKRRLEYLAGRFAVKEAYTKAYGHFEAPLNFKDVSVLPDEHGQPSIQSSYRPEDMCLVSLSHSPHYVVAVCQVMQPECDGLE
ncbi:MAG: holo-ACP synthase [Candidatus Izemoplasmataceae bacterium]